MALVFTGTRTRSGGITSAIKKQVQLLSLQPAKRLTIKFDPFGNNTKNIRDFLCVISGKAAAKTNPFCRIRGEVVCDRSEPTVDIQLVNGDSVLLKCNNLNIVDMLVLINKYVSVLAPKEVPVDDAAISTKGTKLRRKR